MRKIHFYNICTLEQIDQLKRLPEEERFAIKVVANVLPFRVNNYVIEELIDWDNIPADPIYQLTFSQKNMLLPQHFKQMADVLQRHASLEEVRAVANGIRMQLNPHPDGQMTANVPLLDDEPVLGIQHKYRETCLVFPANGQTCHSYCTFCFRWPQFTTIQGLKFATDESKQFQAYLQQHQEITDVLFTGGDPLVMNAHTLAAYIEPLLRPEFEHIQVIRVGTKAIAYWPYRFVSDPDSDEILYLFEKVVAAGKHLAVMGHYNHWKELSTDIAQEAIRQIRSTGAVIRTQSPLLRHINDDAAVWAKLWHEQVRLGCIPYYMFIERQTGASKYFSVPLAQAWQIFPSGLQTSIGVRSNRSRSVYVRFSG